MYIILYMQRSNFTPPQHCGALKMPCTWTRPAHESTVPLKTKIRKSIEKEKKLAWRQPTAGNDGGWVLWSCPPKSGLWLLPTVILLPWPRHSSAHVTSCWDHSSGLLYWLTQVTVKYTLRWTFPIQLIKYKKRKNKYSSTQPFPASCGKWQQMPRYYTSRVPGTRSTSKMVNYLCSVASRMRMAYTLTL